MKKIFFIITAITAFIFSCKKYEKIKSDADNKLYINGRLFILDSIIDNSTVKPLLKEVNIAITYKGDTNNILYVTKTDKDGYFTFTNLKQGNEYTIIAETEIGDGDFKLLYSTQKNVLVNESKNNVTPLLAVDETKQNGVLFTIRDNASLGLINDCKTCFFSSRQLWQRDTCDFGLFSIQSNANGKVVKTNLIPGTKYYVLFKKQAGSLLLKNSDSVIVNNKGLIRMDIKMY